MASKITVGKIVANATETGWSQAYHAGGFTAVVSVVNNKTASSQHDHTLAESGKKLLDTLVSEYFTLTTKDLETIKSAAEATIAKAEHHTNVALVVAAVVKNVLYVVIANEGRVLLKRDDKLGLLLEITPDAKEKVASVSGFLEDGDLVLLTTPAFKHIFTHDELVTAFDHKTAEELAELFAPKVHEAQNGAASALVFSYQKDEASPLEEVLTTPTHSQPQEETPPEEGKQEKELPGFEKPLPIERKKFSFSHQQRLFLTIAVILGIILIGSVVVFQMRQKAAQQEALFTSLFAPAKAKFDEAQGLLSLNKSLALDDLASAQSQLQSAKGKFPANSSQEKQIDSLLSQVSSALTDAQKVPLISAQKAADGASPLLTFAAKQQPKFVTQDTTNFYTADNTGVTQYDKQTQTAKKLITNSGDYKTIGGFDTYFGNFYVADTTGGIDKYTPSGSSFAKSSYFASGVNPDLSKVVSISIDSSIWILASDGTITKYTKGAQDSLTVSGLDTPLKSPTEILTSADLQNVYVLDKGNERVVVVKKDGSFVAAYASDTVRTTSFIDVSEKNKEIYLLSGGTVYQLDLK